jgi:hypothetical protein
MPAVLLRISNYGALGAQERPRHRFDLRGGRLFDHLDATEREVVSRTVMRARSTPE